MTTTIDHNAAMAVRPQNFVPSLWRVHHAAMLLAGAPHADKRGLAGADQPLGRARLVSDGIELSLDELEAARPALVEATRLQLLRNVVKARTELREISAALDLLEQQAARQHGEAA